MNIDISDSVQVFLYLKEQEMKHKIILTTINMNKDKIDISGKKIRGIAEKDTMCIMCHMCNGSQTFVQQKFWTN